MTDNEIIKALEYRIDKFSIAVLDLINRQKAEIERLKEKKQDIKDKYDCQQTVYCDLSDIIKEKCEQLQTAKSEAIKEFAERLIERRNLNQMSIAIVSKDDIDNLVKEMTEA